MTMRHETDIDCGSTNILVVYFETVDLNAHHMMFHHMTVCTLYRYLNFGDWCMQGAISGVLFYMRWLSPLTKNTLSVWYYIYEI